MGDLCFGESGVKKVRMWGDSLEFGSDLFSRCPRLKTLILEPGVLHMPDRLAFGCVSLKQVIVPASLQSVGKQVVEKTPFEQQHQLPSPEYIFLKVLCGSARQL